MSEQSLVSLIRSRGQSMGRVVAILVAATSVLAAIGNLPPLHAYAATCPAPLHNPPAADTYLNPIDRNYWAPMGTKQGIAATIETASGTFPTGTVFGFSVIPKSWGQPVSTDKPQTTSPSGSYYLPSLDEVSGSGPHVTATPGVSSTNSASAPASGASWFWTYTITNPEGIPALTPFTFTLHNAYPPSDSLAGTANLLNVNITLNDGTVCAVTPGSTNQSDQGMNIRYQHDGGVGQLSTDRGSATAGQHVPIDLTFTATSGAAAPPADNNNVENGLIVITVPSQFPAVCGPVCQQNNPPATSAWVTVNQVSTGGGSVSWTPAAEQSDDGGQVIHISVTALFSGATFVVNYGVANAGTPTFTVPNNPGTFPFGATVLNCNGTASPNPPSATGPPCNLPTGTPQEPATVINVPTDGNSSAMTINAPTPTPTPGVTPTPTPTPTPAATPTPTPGSSASPTGGGTPTPAACPAAASTGSYMVDLSPKPQFYDFSAATRSYQAPLGTRQPVEFGFAAGGVTSAGSVVGFSLDASGFANNPTLQSTSPTGTGYLAPSVSYAVAGDPTGTQSGTAALTIGTASGSTLNWSYKLGADLPSGNQIVFILDNVTTQAGTWPANPGGASPAPATPLPVNLTLTLTNASGGNCAWAAAASTFSCNGASTPVPATGAVLCFQAAQSVGTVTETDDGARNIVDAGSTGHTITVTYTYNGGTTTAGDQDNGSATAGVNFILPNRADFGPFDPSLTGSGGGVYTTVTVRGQVETGFTGTTTRTGDTLTVIPNTLAFGDQIVVTYGATVPATSNGMDTQWQPTIAGTSATNTVAIAVAEIQTGCNAGTACTTPVPIPTEAVQSSVAVEPGTVNYFSGNLQCNGSTACPSVTTGSCSTTSPCQQVPAGAALNLQLIAVDVSGNPVTWGNHDLFTTNDQAGCTTQTCPYIPRSIQVTISGTTDSTCPASANCTLPQTATYTAISFSHGVSVSAIGPVSWFVAGFNGGTSTSPGSSAAAVVASDQTTGATSGSPKPNNPITKTTINFVKVVGGAPGGTFGLSAAASASSYAAGTSVTLAITGVGDAYGNHSPGIYPTFTVVAPGGTPKSYVCSAAGAPCGATDPTGGDSIALPATDLKVAGVYTYTAKIVGASPTPASLQFTMVAGPATGFVFCSPPPSGACTKSTMGSAAVGQPFPVTIAATDQYGNVASAFTGAASLADTSGHLAITTGQGANATTTSAFTMGSWSGQLTISQITSSDKITATSSGGGSFNGTSPAFNVTLPPGAISMTVSQSSVAAGTPFGATITILNSDGSTYTGYTGQVGLSSCAHQSDGSCQPDTGLSCDLCSTSSSGTPVYSFQTTDNGQVHLNLTVTLVGSQTLTATITNSSPAVSATSFLSVAAGAPDPTQSTFATPQFAQVVAGGTENLSVTLLDSNQNPVAGVSVTVSAIAAGTQTSCPDPTQVTPFTFAVVNSNASGVATTVWPGSPARGLICFYASYVPAGQTTPTYFTTVPQVTSMWAWNLDQFGNVNPIGLSATPTVSATWNFPIARRLDVSADGTHGYVLDGYGGLHGVCFTARIQGTPHCQLPPNPSLSDYWGDPSLGGHSDHPNWDIARDFVMVAPTPAQDGSGRLLDGGWVLDGYGGVHPFGTLIRFTGFPKLADYFASDVARAIVVDHTNDNYGYVLDAYGGVHGFSTDPSHKPTSLGPARPGQKPNSGQLTDYWGLYVYGADKSTPQNFDIARDLVLVPGTLDGYVVDGYGGIHPFRNNLLTGVFPNQVTLSDYWGSPLFGGHPEHPNWDIVRALGTAPSATATAPQLFVLDGLGGVHADPFLPTGQGNGGRTQNDWVRDLAIA
ncbi:MAG: hypothetical protein ACYDAY_08680 [Candidatus Dormibacteria bacterium]